MLEYDYFIFLVLMSVLVWLLYGIYLFFNKFVMIIGVLYGIFGLLCV